MTPAMKTTAKNLEATTATGSPEALTHSAEMDGSMRVKTTGPSDAKRETNSQKLYRLNGPSHTQQHSNLIERVEIRTDSMVVRNTVEEVGDSQVESEVEERRADASGAGVGDELPWLIDLSDSVEVRVGLQPASFVVSAQMEGWVGSDPSTVEKLWLDACPDGDRELQQQKACGGESAHSAEKRDDRVGRESDQLTSAGKTYGGTQGDRDGGEEEESDRLTSAGKTYGGTQGDRDGAGEVKPQAQGGESSLEAELVTPSDWQEAMEKNLQMLLTGAQTCGSPYVRKQSDGAETLTHGGVMTQMKGKEVSNRSVEMSLVLSRRESIGGGKTESSGKESQADEESEPIKVLIISDQSDKKDMEATEPSPKMKMKLRIQELQQARRKGNTRVRKGVKPNKTSKREGTVADARWDVNGPDLELFEKSMATIPGEARGTSSGHGFSHETDGCYMSTDQLKEIATVVVTSEEVNMGQSSEGHQVKSSNKTFSVAVHHSKEPVRASVCSGQQKTTNPEGQKEQADVPAPLMPEVPVAIVPVLVGVNKEDGRKKVALGPFDDVDEFALVNRVSEMPLVT
jgi:hypothetical protein